jgi:hypothetical protein
LDNAVNNAEINILNPENKNPNENMPNPDFASSYTTEPTGAYILEKSGPQTCATANTPNDTAATKAMQMRNIFFILRRFRLP